MIKIMLKIVNNKNINVTIEIFMIIQKDETMMNNEKNNNNNKSVQISVNHCNKH